MSSSNGSTQSSIDAAESNETCLQIADLFSLGPAVGAGVLTAKLGGSTGAVAGATVGGFAAGLAFCCFFAHSNCGTTSKSNPEAASLIQNDAPVPKTMSS